MADLCFRFNNVLGGGTAPTSASLSKGVTYEVRMDIDRFEAEQPAPNGKPGPRRPRDLSRGVRLINLAFVRTGGGRYYKRKMVCFKWWHVFVFVLAEACGI